MFLGMRWVAKTVVEGFAWMLGASAAKDTYASLKESVERDDTPPEPPPPSPEQLRKAAAKAAKERAAAKKKLDREIDAELKALKKKLED